MKLLDVSNGFVFLFFKIMPLPSSSGAGRERWTGTIFAFLSTSCYAVSNISIRYLTATDYHLDNDWILFFKELIGFSIILPWLIFRLYQGRFRFISKRLIFYVAVAAVLCELIGAHFQILGYAVIGLIISVPLIQSSTLIGVAVLSWYWLGDPLSRRRKIAISILIVAVILLSVGKELTAEPVAEAAAPQSTGIFLLVAAGTVVGGIAFSIYIVMLRYAIRKYWHDDNSAWLSFSFSQWVGFDYLKHAGQRQYSPFPVTLMMNIVLGVGLLIFGSFLFLKQGTAGFYDVPLMAWHIILISGLSNMVGFFFQIQGLRMTTAVQASLIAVSQIIVLSLVGHAVFSEPVNLLVILGLCLTAYGVIMSAKPELNS